MFRLVEATLQSIGWGLRSTAAIDGTEASLLGSLDPRRAVGFSLARPGFTLLQTPPRGAARGRKIAERVQPFPTRLLEEAAGALDFCLATFPPVNHRWEEFKFQFVQRYEGEPTTLANALDVWSLVTNAKVTEAHEDHILLPALLEALATKKDVKFAADPSEQSHWSQLASAALSFRLARNLLDRPLPVIVVDACTGPFASTALKPTTPSPFAWEAEHEDLLALEGAHAGGRRILEVRPNEIAGAGDGATPRLFLARCDGTEECPISVDEIDVSIAGVDVVLHTRAGDVPLAVRTGSSGRSALATFLHAVSHQETTAVRDFWGSLAQSPRLPRLWYGNVLLCPARFGLRWEEQSASNLRRQLDACGAPRKLAFVDPSSFGQSGKLATIGSIRERLAEEGAVVVEEALEWVDVDAHKTSASIFVLPFRCTTGDTPGDEATSRNRSVAKRVLHVAPEGPWTPFLHEPEHRRFFPSSSVLDLRVEATPAVLGEMLLACAAHLEQAGSRNASWLKRWLFVFPGGDKSELRLRFFLAGDGAQGVAESRATCHELLDALLASREASIHNASFATYVRELPRYGGRIGVCFAEALFAFDTQASVTILREVSSGRHADPDRERMRAYLTGALFMMSLLNVTEDHRWRVLEFAFAAWRDEFDTDIDADVARLADREAPYVAELAADVVKLVETDEPSTSRDPYVRAYAAILPDFKAWADAYGAAYLANLLQYVHVNALLVSFFHMHASRVFDRDLRRQEATSLGALGRILRRLADAATSPAASTESPQGQ